MKSTFTGIIGFNINLGRFLRWPLLVLLLKHSCMQGHRNTGMTAHIYECKCIVLINIFTCSVWPRVLCFLPASGSLWEDNILFCLCVCLSCRQLACCQQITAFIHNDCDREILCAWSGKLGCACLLSCTDLCIFHFYFCTVGTFDLKRLRCCWWNLFKPWFNLTAVTTVWSPFEEIPWWDLRVQFKPHGDT